MKLVHEYYAEGYGLQTVRCDECGIDGPVAVMIGEEPSPNPNHQGATSVLCLACLEKALGLLRAVRAEEFNANTIAAYDLLDDEQKKDIAGKFVAFLESSK